MDLARTSRLLAHQLGIGDHVIFLGPVHGREKVALYQHARVFGLPSDDENFGMVVAEAMAAGTPVVLSDRVALHGIVAARDAGSVVGIAPAEVAAGLLPYLLDEDLARERGSNGAAVALEQFSWEAVAERFEQMYSERGTSRRVFDDDASGPNPDIATRLSARAGRIAIGHYGWSLKPSSCSTRS